MNPVYPITVLWVALALQGCYVPNEREGGRRKDLERPRVRLQRRCPLTCARIRQRLIPSSCVEKVRLQFSQDGAVVRGTEIQPVVCAGL